MLGDTILFQQEHYVKKDYLLKKFLPLFQEKKTVITISGESGTGKTEIAKLLQADLWNLFSIRAKVIHVDDYYKVTWQRRTAWRKLRGLDIIGCDEINWEKLKSVIKTFKSDAKKLYAQKIHKFTDSIEYVIANNRNIDVLIVEGLYAGCPCQNMEKYLDYNVFLEGSVKETKEFRLKRKKEVMDSFRDLVLKKEHEAIQKIRKTAHLVIPFYVQRIPK